MMMKVANQAEKLEYLPKEKMASRSAAIRSMVMV